MEVEKFQALVIDKNQEGFHIGLKQMALDNLPEGEVLIRVQYSSLNYKDGLACTPNGGIVRSYPHVPGVDLAGVVITSTDVRFEPGQQVIVTGFGLGVSHFGGFSQVARVPAKWVVPLPAGLQPQEAMLIGTAGLTAAISIELLEHNGLSPEQGSVLVSGATGGVGSFAVAMLAARGYKVVAATGKASEHAYLHALGAREIIGREQLNPEVRKPLEKQQWAAAIDPVGGSSLAFILASLQAGGAAAVSGLTGGVDVPTTVHPFILRGVHLLGVDSVNYPIDRRSSLWEQIARDLKQQGHLEHIARLTIPLREVAHYAEEIRQGRIRGRVVIEV
ncbi:oxidoreductase [Paenibacillus agricola]|uniref:Oxidoreductase n=1 Tax=Paenibacillus agricola TaxID=2716264 RepID=A0ABX0J2N9_9BACL|nr:oxidoreductase [Paenibacillus agricola]NHN28254.1 oxidoreductase [Paenibacillus agricola]